MTQTSRLLSLLLLVLVGATGCKDRGKWLHGKWLLIEDGKPTFCHEFKEKTFLVYVGAECKGSSDPILSGKWQLKGENKIAVLRGQEELGKIVIVSERSDTKIVVSNDINGELHRVGESGSAAVISALEDKGVIKVRALPPRFGCEQLGKAIKEITPLPKEKQPRMIRAQDEGLQYHALAQTGDPNVEKVVFGVNQDQIDWIAFHLTEAAFSAPGPEGRLEQQIGKPEHTATTGVGDKKQTISMWKAYCAKLRGATNKNIDITLFSTAGKKQAYYYVSEGVISSTWQELKDVASDPTQQADEEDDEEEGDTKKPATPPPAPKTAPVKAAPPPPPPPPPKPPKVSSPPKAAPTPPKAAPTPPKGRPTKGGLAVPGRDDEI